MDPASWSKIQSVYGSVDEIDLFVGGLAELPTQGDIKLKTKFSVTFKLARAGGFNEFYPGH